MHESFQKRQKVHISDYGLNSLIRSLEQGIFDVSCCRFFYDFFYISLYIRTDSLLQEKSDTLCVACYIKCVKLFFQRTNTNRLEIADNDISISLFTVSR